MCVCVCCVCVCFVTRKPRDPRSKRRGTWSCSTTLTSQRPANETKETAQTGNACGKCPVGGEDGWQGEARIINSTLETTSDVRGPISFAFGKLWVSAKARGVVRFEYVARKDCGCFDRHGSFRIDRRYKEIQQTTGRAYPKHCLVPTRNGLPWSLDGLDSAEIRDSCVKVISYDRGHLIPANHFDHDKNIIRATNAMINILPQVDKMNRGAWLATEMIVECLRDEEVLTVLGGVVYPPHGRSATATFFVESHGVVTPTHFWKVIVAKSDGRYAKDNGLLAFWMPNSANAVAKVAAKFVVSISQLERNLRAAKAAAGGHSPSGWPLASLVEVFDLPKVTKDHVPEFWGTLEGCDRA